MSRGLQDSARMVIAIVLHELPHRDRYTLGAMAETVAYCKYTGSETLVYLAEKYELEVPQGWGEYGEKDLFKNGKPTPLLQSIKKDCLMQLKRLLKRSTCPFTVEDPVSRDAGVFTVDDVLVLRSDAIDSGKNWSTN